MFGQRWRDDESCGELSEGQRPVLTVAQERVVMGHSLISQHQSIQPSAIQSQNTYAILSSPGQSETQQTGTLRCTCYWVHESSLCLADRTQTGNVSLIFNIVVVSATKIRFV